MQWRTEIRRNIAWPDLEAEQNRFVAAVREQQSESYLLLSEPNPTYTFGRSASPDDSLWSPALLAERGIVTAQVSRGGKWTYHGPGQLLLYPILQFEACGYGRRDIRQFLENLREGVVAYLASLDLPAPDPAEKEPFGIYYGGKKLVSFGIAVERGVCSHGLALYLRPQTESFAGIHPCGVPGQDFTSLSELGREKDFIEVAAPLAESVKRSLAKNSAKLA